MRLTPRYLLKCAASVVATVLGVMLLVADEDDSCENYEAFQQSLDFTSDCPFAPSQGRLSLDFPAQRVNGSFSDESLAHQQLEAAGFSVDRTVHLDFIGACTRDTGQSRVSGMGFSLGNSNAPLYRCYVPLPVSQTWTVSCSRGTDASADSKQDDAGATDSPSCSIAFRAAAR